MAIDNVPTREAELTTRKVSGAAGVKPLITLTFSVPLRLA